MINQNAIDQRRHNARQSRNHDRAIACACAIVSFQNAIRETEDRTTEERIAHVVRERGSIASWSVRAIGSHR